MMYRGLKQHSRVHRLNFIQENKPEFKALLVP